VFFDASVELSIGGCVFAGNVHGAGSGGALHLSDGSTVMVSTSRFEANSSPSMNLDVSTSLIAETVQIDSIKNLGTIQPVGDISVSETYRQVGPPPGESFDLSGKLRIVVDQSGASALHVAGTA